MTHLRNKLLCLMMALALCIPAGHLYPTAAAEPEGALTVYCFSAGKADAFLLTTARGAVLIDCGEKGFGKEILAHLKAHGIRRIDYMIITHFDKDHVGGAAKVLNGVPVGCVLQSNCPKESPAYEKYLAALSNASIEPVTVRTPYRFTLDGVAYAVDPPKQDSYDKHASNNASLILSAVHGKNTFLFMGDAQTERLEEFLDGDFGHFDFLKVPHHGQKEKLMPELLAAVTPAYAVITSSDETPEVDSTIRALENADVEIFLTRIAPVIAMSDGAALTVYYEND